ncbi:MULTISPECIES: type I secretion system permease/ATPase [Cobetia]|uniref:type I secretion system permease/ATPase n=1 Tax=Cobetia TaxID=204286 RepID=UPI000865A60C|nr:MULTISPECIES: type I secretion system permease/ATPase [Cobetia]AOM00514.1 peptidase [Cobetia marina]AZV30600.1 type I secretion system permease/ATPase [Cobetia sp. ICG0124]
MAISREGNDLQKILDHCRHSFVYVGLFSLFINLLMLVPPLYMLQVYDRVITTRSQETLLMLTLVVVFLFMVMGALELIRSRILVRVGNRLDVLISPRLYTAMFKHSLMTPGKPSAQPLNDLTTLRQFLSGNGLFAFFDAPWVPIYIGVLALFHPWFGLFALGAGLVLTVIALINEKTTRKLLSDANGQHVLSQDLANSNLRNAEVLHAMGMLPGIQNRWEARHREYLVLQSKASDRAGLLTNTSKVLRLMFQSLILGLGAYLVLTGDLTPGMMIAGSILMGRALAPIDQIITGWKGFSGARTSRARLEELLEAVPAEAPSMPLPAPKGRLTLEAVNAAPPGERLPTLKDITLTLARGEHIAVVGPSAAGKSTLARVILGLWPVQLGCVRLDGVDVSQWKRTALGPHLGYLPQDIELFDGSIAENIARFQEVDASLVVQAAQSAGVHDMILRLPQGYDTWLSHGGAALSAGQRQRIGLARALYGKPVLVVLDEPDANLDESGEQALAKCLMQLRQAGTTAIIITHRQRLLQQVDRILVLKDGQVASLSPPTRGRPVARAVAGKGHSTPSRNAQRVTELKPSARGRHEGGEESPR